MNSGGGMGCMEAWCEFRQGGLISSPVRVRPEAPNRRGARKLPPLAKEKGTTGNEEIAAPSTVTARPPLALAPASDPLSADPLARAPWEEPSRSPGGLASHSASPASSSPEIPMRAGMRAASECNTPAGKACQGRQHVAMPGEGRGGGQAWQQGHGPGGPGGKACHGPEGGEKDGGKKISRRAGGRGRGKGDFKGRV